MARKDGPRPVPLGGGKFCYSGPTCKLHSKMAPGMVTNQQVINPVEEFLQKNIANFKAVEKQWICSQETSIPSMEGFQRRLLDFGSLARFCSEHEIYHVYNVSDFRHMIFRTQTGDITTGLSKFLREKNLPLNEFSLLQHYVAAKFYNEVSGISQDTALLRSLDPVSFDAFKNRVASEGLEYKKSGAIHPKKNREVVPLAMSSDKVPDVVLLEFWKCYRKKKFNSAQEAQTHSALIDDTVNPYNCSYCNMYHLGHGDGKGSDADAIRKAREDWHIYPEEANSIVRKYNLVP